ncbi:ABC transporter substrate-binding protein [Phaeobacter sp. HF9A]|uniref:ABC transporter substrate-binding protein n=1 Tax=Phaeobacter sp. HF9A TaxID=2721561 RepID=UPI001431BDFF|nr:ABC transporter substrate-binding protein [Phaeobacter sp. HF9A]NIZ12296.1 ABC transporter substrate-binding protein [Phaeobacter sp. HF9A]
MRRILLFLLIVLIPVAPVAAGQSVDSFPIRVVHQYGETTIATPPERVVSVGYHEQDFLYALGIAPVGVHEWFGNYPYATWPWAESARQALGAAPGVQRGFEIDIEWVLAQDPDLIVATFAPLDQRSYAILSQIAPVVGPPAGYPAWGAPWQEELRLIGRATGTATRAETVLAELDSQIKATARTFPQLSGLRGTAAHFAGGQIIGYRSADGANRLLARLGIKTPPGFDDLAGSGGNFGISLERIDLLDLDVVLWLVDAPSRQRIEALAPYQALRLSREARSVWADRELMGAMSFQSPLSITWALERLAPALAAAADGDPATDALPGLRRNGS